MYFIKKYRCNEVKKMHIKCTRTQYSLKCTSGLKWRR